MEYECIKYEKEDGFVVIIMNRPERLNAWSEQMMKELSQAHFEILKDKEVRAWIVTGAPRPDGRPCFSAGADLKEDAEGKPRWNDPYHRGPMYLEEDKLFPLNTAAGKLWAKRPRLSYPYFTNIIWSPKISIAAVDGVATAGGIELALVCDIILVSETAQIFDSHVKNLQLAIGGGSVTTGLARKVGYSKALELCLLGEPMNGKEAYSFGFANQVYPPNRLLPEAKNMARKIAGMRPSAVQMTKLSCRSVDGNFNKVWDDSDELLHWQFVQPMQDDGFGEYPGIQGVTQRWEKRKG